MSKDELKIIESPLLMVVADLAKNGEYITPELQNAIAKFISLETTPIIVLAPPKHLSKRSSDARNTKND